MSTKTSFICRSYTFLGILFELFLLAEPNQIRRSIEELLHQQTIGSFYCPCGSTVSEEQHINIHLRTKHKETYKMYLAVKKSVAPDSGMSNATFEYKYNMSYDVYIALFHQLHEVEPG